MSPSVNRRVDPAPEPPRLLSDLYDEALPEVYGYLRRRCSSVELAEELTSATFVTAALQQADRGVDGRARSVSIGWLITVARNKLIDHWRRQAVAERSMALLEGGATVAEDPWDAVLDAGRSRAVLDQLPAHHRMALTLRYLDDLPVAEVAELMERSIRSTESLLARARLGFRERYEKTSDEAEATETTGEERR